MCKHHQHPVVEHLPPQNTPQYSFAVYSVPTSTDLLSVSLDLLFLDLHVNEFIQYIAFYSCLFFHLA